MKIKLKINQAPRSIWTNPIDFIAAAFGAGAMPIAPGTFGTLAAIPFIYWLSQFNFFIYFIVTLVLVIGGIFICDRAGKDFGVTDHSAIVWDEFAAFFIVMMGIPMNWFLILAGFLLFRFFDILKPGPIRWLENHMPGGLGVMMDDVLAGLISWFILFFVVQIFL